MIIYSHAYLQTIWQLLCGDILEQEQAGCEPAAGWKLPALPLNHQNAQD